MKRCIDCEHYFFDIDYDEETGEEYDIGYCKIQKDTDGMYSKACDDFISELKGENNAE